MIASVIANSSRADLDIPVRFTDGTQKDLRFLMTDYADHLQHHLRQLTQPIKPKS